MSVRSVPAARAALAILQLIGILSWLPLETAQGQLLPGPQEQIEYLLRRIETAGCSFYRNGTWYDGPRAVAHLRTKYDYLAARHLISTAEDFIDKAATKSSVSGKPYKVRCGSDPETESGPWLRKVLASYRPLEPKS